MLISNNIKKAIEAEIKSQQALVNMLIKQEASYNVDLTATKTEINNTIAYYEKVIKEAE